MWVGSDSAMMPAASLCREPILSAVHVSILVTWCVVPRPSQLGGREESLMVLGFPATFTTSHRSSETYAEMLEQAGNSS